MCLKQGLKLDLESNETNALGILTIIVNYQITECGTNNIINLICPINIDRLL
jgi:hypothetical protein